MIHTIAIPTPFMVGRVNTYLVEDDPLTLVDTGPNSGKALDELEQALNGLGHRVEDLGLIVLTHQHIDHIGLADILARRSGADVAALDALAPWLAQYRERMDADDAFAERIMGRHGVPEELRFALRAVSSSFRGWGAQASVTVPLHDGGQLALRDRTYTVHHRPGHSPSDTIFHDAASGTVLGGDHLIKHISSNPLITRPLDGDESARPHALLTYMRSMRATAAMDGVAEVLTGHGDPVEDVAALVEDRFRMHDRRAAKIHRILGAGPLTAFEIATEMWGNVAVTQAFLTLSEVLGHLDLLVERGQAVEEDDGEVARFRAV